MGYTAEQLYKAIQPKTKAQYERAFAIARQRGYVGRFTLKHKLAIIHYAYTLWVRQPASKANKLDKHLLTAARLHREDLYALLNKTCVWTESGWVEKFHISSARDLINGWL